MKNIVNKRLAIVKMFFFAQQFSLSIVQLFWMCFLPPRLSTSYDLFCISYVETQKNVEEKTIKMAFK